jgi:hypothetical protein
MGRKRGVTIRGTFYREVMIDGKTGLTTHTPRDLDDMLWWDREGRKAHDERKRMQNITAFFKRF